ncbi:MAG: xanthine dehydrogenase [Planctomycetes bacterium]|nr:xanthine dehydrogenase [Planctomycetota bacterium]
MSIDVFEEIVRLRKERVPAALATVVSAKGSTPAKMTTRMLVTAMGRVCGTVGGGCVEADVIRAARDVIDTGRPRTLSFKLVGEEAERTGIACGGIVDVMVEPLEDPRVVIVGAGHVGQAVARLATDVGLQVTVVDDRPDFANAERFPAADEIIVAELDALRDAVGVGPRTSILVMTRGHAEDYGVLRWALTTPAGRIGVLGSRSKRKRFIDDLRAEGHDTDRIDNVSMPVGLDLGAETVPEIAVSIVAELIAHRRGVRPAHA